MLRNLNYFLRFRFLGKNFFTKKEHFLLYLCLKMAKITSVTHLRIRSEPLHLPGRNGISGSGYDRPKSSRSDRIWIQSNFCKRDLIQANLDPHCFGEMDQDPKLMEKLDPDPHYIQNSGAVDAQN